MWTTFSVMVVISMAVRQIIMDFRQKELQSRCQELEKKVADLEERVQAQPLGCYRFFKGHFKSPEYDFGRVYQ